MTLGGNSENASADHTPAQPESMVDAAPRENLKSRIPAATLLVGVVVAIIYFCQLRAMIHSNEINRETLQSVQRPFVSILSMEGMREIDPTTNRIVQVHLSFTWQNSGNTPTKNLRAHVNHTFEPGSSMETSLPNDFTFPDFWAPNEDHAGTPIFVSPGKGTATYEAVILSAADAEAVFQKKESAYFWGWARYQDTFPGTEEHVFAFCSKLVGFTADPMTLDASVKPELRNCKRHNCYDEECRAER